MTLKSHYDVALVQHNLVNKFADAKRALHQIRGYFEREELLRIDILFEPPTLLMCLLHFDKQNPGPFVMPQISAIARAGYFRTLRLARLSENEQERFFNHHLQRFSYQAFDVQQLKPVLDEVWQRMSQPKQAPLVDLPRTRSIHYESPQDFLLAHRLTDAGNTLALQRALDVNEPLLASISVGASIGPVHLTVQSLAGDVSAELGLEPRCVLLLPPSEQDLFESFFIAVTRGTPWPERSGRCYERFPIHLRVEYTLDDEHRREATCNVSRGGFALDSFAPPAVGEQIDFLLYAPGNSEAINVRGQIVWSTDAAAAANADTPCGAGVTFVDPPEEVHARVRKLLENASVVSQRRALVVDDDRFFRTVLGNVLRLAGFEVLERDNGEDACQCLLDELLHLDVLITDLYMPGISGKELLHRIRSIGGELDLAIVVMTGTRMDSEQVNALKELGADDVLRKDSAFEDVLACIERVIEAKQLFEISE